MEPSSATRLSRDPPFATKGREQRCDKRTGIMAHWQARFCRHRQKRASHVARNDRTRKLSRQRTRPGARRSYVCPGGETSLSRIARSEGIRFSEFGHFLPRRRRFGAFMPLPLADPAYRKRSSHRTGGRNAMAKNTSLESRPLERIGRGSGQASGKGASAHPIARSGRNTRLSRFTSVLSSSCAMPRTAFILRMR